jgi:hypothetical protein
VESTEQAARTVRARLATFEEKSRSSARGGQARLRRATAGRLGITSFAGGPSNLGQKFNGPAGSAGPPVVCLELAEGAKAFCESKLRQDLKAHALSLSHLTFVTTIRTFHFYGSPSFPVYSKNNFKRLKIQDEKLFGTGLV